MQGTSKAGYNETFVNLALGSLTDGHTTGMLICLLSPLVTEASFLSWVRQMEVDIETTHYATVKQRLKVLLDRLGAWKILRASFSHLCVCSWQELGSILQLVEEEVLDYKHFEQREERVWHPSQPGSVLKAKCLEQANSANDLFYSWCSASMPRRLCRGTV